MLKQKDDEKEPMVANTPTREKKIRGKYKKTWRRRIQDGEGGERLRKGETVAGEKEGV